MFLFVDCLTKNFQQDIIRLPRLFRFLQKPLAQFISVARAPKSKEGYASIGGGSPLRQITDAQACYCFTALVDNLFSLLATKMLFINFFRPSLLLLQIILTFIEIS